VGGGGGGVGVVRGSAPKYIIGPPPALS